MGKRITIKDPIKGWEFEMDGDDSHLGDQEKDELASKVSRMMDDLHTIFKVDEYLSKGRWRDFGWIELEHWLLETDAEEILLKLKQGVKYDI